MKKHKGRIIKIAAMIGVVVSLPLPGPAEQAGKGQITVQVRNVKNNQGNIKLSVYNSEAGFPGRPEKAMLRTETVINNRTATVILPALDYGRYAIAIVHDENKNGKLDTMLFGIPKEGVGVSNNFIGTLRPPKFDESVFQLSEPELKLVIRLNYL